MIEKHNITRRQMLAACVVSTIAVPLAAQSSALPAIASGISWIQYPPGTTLGFNNRTAARAILELLHTGRSLSFGTPLEKATNHWDGWEFVEDLGEGLTRRRPLSSFVEF